MRLAGEPSGKRTGNLHFWAYGRGLLYPDDPELGDLPIFLLGHLGFLSMPWWFGNPPRYAAWITLAALTLFLPIYFRAWWRNGRELLLPIALMALIGMATIQTNWGANVFIVFACAFAGIITNTRDYLITVAVVLLAFVAECRWLGLPPIVDAVTLLVASVVAAANHSECQTRRRRAVLRMSQEEVERLARLAERERIARDLHDLLGHTLSVVALKSDLARRLCDSDPLRARQEIADVEKVARQALAQVRSAVTGIRAAGLRTELARVRLMLEAADLRLQVDLSDEALPVEVETTLAFALREACTNIVRHARASRVQVALRVEQVESLPHARMRISDDGRGGVRNEGNGLRGMRERIEQLGGSLSYSSSPGQGTALQIDLPIDARHGSDALNFRVQPG